MISCFTKCHQTTTLMMIAIATFSSVGISGGKLEGVPKDYIRVLDIPQGKTIHQHFAEQGEAARKRLNEHAEELNRRSAEQKLVNVVRIQGEYHGGDVKRIASPGGSTGTPKEISQPARAADELSRLSEEHARLSNAAAQTRGTVSSEKVYEGTLRHIMKPSEGGEAVRNKEHAEIIMQMAQVLARAETLAAANAGEKNRAKLADMDANLRMKYAAALAELVRTEKRLNEISKKGLSPEAIEAMAVLKIQEIFNQMKDLEKFIGPAEAGRFMSNLFKFADNIDALETARAMLDAVKKEQEAHDTAKTETSASNLDRAQKIFLGYRRYLEAYSEGFDKELARIVDTQGPQHRFTPQDIEHAYEVAGDAAKRFLDQRLSQPELNRTEADRKVADEMKRMFCRCTRRARSCSV